MLSKSFTPRIGKHDYVSLSKTYLHRMCVKIILFLLSKTYAPRIRNKSEIVRKLNEFLSAYQMTHHYFVNVTTIHVVLVENVKSPLLVTNVFAVQVNF